LTNEDGTARIFDAATGAAVAALIGHAKAVGRALYSRDGQHVATASWDNTAIVRSARRQRGQPSGYVRLQKDGVR
jgi:WD40 repeat protein